MDAQAQEFEETQKERKTERKKERKKPPKTDHSMQRSELTQETKTRVKTPRQRGVGVRVVGFASSSMCIMHGGMFVKEGSVHA